MRRARERFRKEEHIGMLAVDLGDQPMPERDRLGVRIVDAEDLDALADPEEHDIAQREPQRGKRLAVEMHVDDVFVFLRRVFGIRDRAVLAPLEPFRMFLDPGMVGRTLDGEIERYLEIVRARRFDERAGNRPSCRAAGCSAS